jgi:hypothetical protein
MTSTTDDTKNLAQFAILGTVAIAGIAGLTGIAITGIAIHLGLELCRKHYG